MKRIGIVTGTRAEYGHLRPLLAEVGRRAELELLVVAAGMHLAPEFGHTVDEIQRDGFVLSGCVEMHPAKDSPAEMGRCVGRGVVGFATLWERLQPEVVVVLGDRTEALAAVIAAAYQNIVCAHIHGGDTSQSGLDESARHAITKFAHLHFPATRTSAARIRRLGEEEWRIQVVGSPTLDTVLALRPLPRAELAQKLSVPLDSPLVLFVQHPVTTEPEAARSQIAESLAALTDLGLPVVALYPNSDSGGRGMIESLEEFARGSHRWIFKSLPHRVYLSLLRHAAVLVGNSSSGIIESASFGLPVVDVGLRQKGRECAANVIHVPHERGRILAAIRRALSDEFRASIVDLENPYGDGDTAPRITDVLARTERSPRLIKKQITY